MINPDVHINIYISAEVMQMVCATIGFAIAMWAYIKALQIWRLGKKPEEKDNA